MTTALLIAVLSVLSNLGVWAMLRAPSYAAEYPVPAPRVVAPLFDDGYFDIGGLT